MTLITPKGMVTPQSGNVTNIIIGEQENYSTPLSISGGAVNSATARTSDGFHGVQPRLNQIDIARSGSTIPTNFFTGTAAQTKDAAGPLDITNGFVLPLTVNGSELMLRMLTQDADPTWTIWGGTTKTIPAEVTIVAAQPLSTDTTADGASATHTDMPTQTSPVRPEITISATASLSTGGRGRILIVGTDYEDRPISETVAFTDPLPTDSAGTRVAAVASSKLWYKTITDVRSAGWSSGGTFGVTARNRSARVIFTPDDTDLRAFWTIEASKGVVPNVYDGVIVENATMEITRDALMEWTCSVLGRQARLYTNLSGATLDHSRTADGTAPGYLDGTNRAMPSKRQTTGSTAIRLASPDVYAGWQCEISGGNDIAMATSDSTLTLNQELEYTNVTGSRFQVTKPTRSGKRLLQLEASTVYATQNNYSEYFNSNRPLQNVQIKWSQSGLGAYPYELILEVPEMQLTSDPDPAVTDFGTIYQNVMMKAIEPENESVEYDYRFIARFSSYSVLGDLT